ncbi:membrane protein [Ureibacillus massiliensis 4400831 = CIP 108448 = CCUG 49529]|uniref:Membrane protein n=1 Tax=Ureibacillus massiliensis 4400831 = CIP 108448 = CCUG 49529 TaxID=1211035 RepID=A0A0A3IN62_9BACL|nr:ECF transporter S component [Ureibacillus massiliensis]KGR84248.1 membrane protein [Ureibacillus massiliensis 4400831 = CIP 108448 = CCUG 49529]
MKIREFTLTTTFLSIILLFALTPVGFIHLGVIKATIIHIPIIIASIILGPKIGAFLGLVFGITSIITNTIAPTLLSFAFSPAIPVLGTSQGSFWALFIAIVPRVLIGFIPYYMFKAVSKALSKKKPNQKLAFFLTGLLSTFLHTFLVMGSISLIFQDAYAQAINADSSSAIFKAVMTVFLTNGITEAIIAAIVTSLVAPPLYKLSKK